MKSNGVRTWQEICSEKREKRNNAIPLAWRIPNMETSTAKTNLLEVPSLSGILTENEIHITTDYDAVGIVEAIRERLFTAEAVTTAFCKRAAIAQQLVSSRLPFHSYKCLCGNKDKLLVRDILRGSD